MADFRRDAHIAQIYAVKAKMKTAGTIHRKDLSRQLGRLERELREYDKHRKAAACRG